MSAAGDRIKAAFADFVAHEDDDQRAEMHARLHDAVLAAGGPPSNGTACSCSRCSRGLWCLDGQRAEFASGSDECKLCNQPGWKHWTVKP